MMRAARAHHGHRKKILELQKQASMQSMAGGMMSMGSPMQSSPLRSPPARTGSIGTQLKEGIFTKNPRLWESMTYLAFVCIFTWVALSSQDNAGYRLTQAIRDTYGSFNDVGTFEDWWDFTEGDFVSATFPETWYNGDPLDTADLRHLASTYPLLGAVAIRQVRVKADSCEIPVDLANVSSSCYGRYATSTEDRTQYGPPVLGSSELSYQYQTDRELGCRIGCSTIGRLNTYGGGGFNEILPSIPAAGSELEMQAQVRAKLEQLKGGLWIDKQTRALFTQLTVYNLPTDLLAVVTLSVEFSEKGGSATFIDVLTLRIGHLYPNKGPILALAAEGILLCMVFGYITQSVLLWRKSGSKEYWGSAWHYFEWINYMLFLVAFGLRYGAFINASQFEFPPDPNDFVFYAGAGNFVEQWKNVMGANAFLTWFKIFKYFSHIPFMGRLVKVLGAAAEDVVAFLICFAVVHFGFCIAFMLSYGNHLEDYSTLGRTNYALYRMILGDFDFAGLLEYNRLLGPVYFVTFTMLTMCMLLNMFVAIVMEGYDQVREEEEKVSVIDFIKEKVEHAVTALRRSDKDEAKVAPEQADPKMPAQVHPEAVLEQPYQVYPVQHDGFASAGVDKKLRDDMETVLATLVDFRREVKHLSRRVQHIADNDPRKPLPPSVDPAFIE